MKLTEFIGLKCTEAEKAAFVASARQHGVSLGEYLRRLHRLQAAAAQPVAPLVDDALVAPIYEIFSVDDLGPDPLYAGEKALRR